MVKSTILIFTSIFFALSLSEAQTQEESRRGFGISPAHIQLQGNPGQRVNSSFILAATNTTATSRYTIEVRDLNQSNEGTIQVVDAGLGYQSCASWISVAEELEIPAGGSMDIPITITYPTANPGHYYAYIIIQVQPERPSANIAVLVRPALSIKIEAMVLGRGKTNIEVKDMKLVPVTGKDNYCISLLASNPGVWRLDVTGDMLLYGPTSIFPTKVPIPFRPGGKPFEIYPGYEVDLICPLTEVPSPGKYRAEVRLLLNGAIRSVSNLEFEVPASLTGKSVSSKILTRSEFDLDMSVNPQMVELTLTPGAVRTVPIRIQNRDERTTEIRAYVSDVKMEVDGSLTFPAKIQESNDWISISPETVSIESKRTASIKAQVKVPRDTTGFGAFVKAVRINATGPLTVGGRVSGAEFGVLLVAKNPKSPPSKLEVSKPNLIYPVEGANPTTAVVPIYNSGGKVATFKGKLQLERTNGQVIAFMNLGKDQEEIILPGSSREFRMTLPPLDQGGFLVKAEFVTLGKKPVWERSEVSFTSTTTTPKGLK